MKIYNVIEYGYDEALKGLSFNKKQNKSMKNVAFKLAGKGGGHDKFLRQIMLWVEMEATQTFWLQFDTYNFTVSQSESKMHCILKHEFKQSDFLNPIDEDILKKLNELRDNNDFNALIDILPMSYIQKRMVMLSYAQLDTIIKQRKNHKLKEWRDFCKEIVYNLKHPEFLGKKDITIF